MFYSHLTCFAFLKHLRLRISLSKDFTARLRMNGLQLNAPMRMPIGPFSAASSSSCCNVQLHFRCTGPMAYEDAFAQVFGQIWQLFNAFVVFCLCGLRLMNIFCHIVNTIKCHISVRQVLKTKLPIESTWLADTADEVQDSKRSASEKLAALLLTNRCLTNGDVFFLFHLPKVACFPECCRCFLFLPPKKYCRSTFKFEGFYGPLYKFGTCFRPSNHWDF